ncbi:class B sortase [Lacrimispora amygdalina]|uniref:class B sortase n=1 Tax=Lacrimispora amygdalina TaxID=253257 RepID=UPI000BE2F016|nr:class B sortase [Lacrimispora amygdalina]
MKKKVIYHIVFLLLFAFFIICSTLLINYYSTGYKNTLKIKKVKNITEKISEREIEDFYETNLNKQISASQKDRIKTFLSYKNFKNINADYCGWLHIPDTKIDYPVLQSQSIQDFYLDHDFYQDKNSSGSIYLDNACIVGYSNNYIIYGHHMKDGTMFASLNKYQSKEYYLDHDKMQFDTLYDIGDYQVISVLKMSESDLNHSSSFLLAETKDKFNQLTEFINKNKIYDTGQKVYFGDKLLTLITCEYSYKNGRILIIAKRINEIT